jgi:hypothetical protein
MQKTNDHLAAKAGGVAGFLATAVLGWNLVGGSAVPVAEKSKDPAPASLRDRTSRPQRASGISAVAVQQMSAIRGGRNSTERLRATIDLAGSLPPSDFAAWLDGGWFSLRDGAELTLFTKIIQERWKLEDPGGYAAWVMERNPSEAAKVLGAWAEADPRRVVNFFKLQSGDGSGMQILGELSADHPAVVLQCLRELNTAGFPQSSGYYVSEILREIVKKSPGEVEAFVGELSGQLKLQAEGVVIGAKMEADYAGELRKLWDRPEGMKIFENLEGSMKVRIFDELANLPPDWRVALVSDLETFMNSKTAVKWMNVDLMALGFSEKQEETVRKQALVYAARENPEAAFKLMEEVGLSADERRNLIRRALSGRRDQTDAVIALLTSESDREIARSIMDQPSASIPQVEKIETPAQWLEKIATLDPKAGNFYHYASMVRNWDDAKVSAIGSQFRSLPSEKRQMVAQIIVDKTHYFTPALAGEAIHYLITDPVPDPDADGRQSGKFEPISTASSYVGRLAVKDPETASEWIRTLPEGEAKAWSQMNLRSVWAQYDPKAAEQWFKTLPAATQAQVLDLSRKNKD